MLPSQESIALVARRIEQAYLRRHPGWTSNLTSSGVWASAASGFLMLHINNPSLPVDPELFVAVQPRREPADPWADMSGEAAMRRYRRRIRRIISQLRDEIKEEVRRVERRVRRGSSLTAVLSQLDDQVSPLGRFVVARRAGQFELAERVRAEAERQHRSCPLYQEACRSLLPGDSYPLPPPTGLPPGLSIPAGLELPCFSMN